MSGGTIPRQGVCSNRLAKRGNSRFPRMKAWMFVTTTSEHRAISYCYPAHFPSRRRVCGQAARLDGGQDDRSRLQPSNRCATLTPLGVRVSKPHTTASLALAGEGVGTHRRGGAAVVRANPARRWGLSAITHKAEDRRRRFLGHAQLRLDLRMFNRHLQPLNRIGW